MQHGMDERPRRRMIQIRLSLYVGEDDELLAKFSAIPRGQRALYVHRALLGAPMPTFAAQDVLEKPIDLSGMFE